MPLEFAVSALVTLLVVVDPVGLVPAFISMTEGLPSSARRQVAIRACLIALCILLGSALIGDWLLKHLGIGLPAFRIAGGLLLFWIASDMVFGWRVERDARTAEQAVHEHVRNIAAFPLAIPLLAGPGAITAVILLAGRTRGDLAMLGGILGVIVLVMLSSLVVFLFATRIAKLLGVTGNIVMSRLLGVILAALAVQFVIDGVRAVWS
ncbi:MAG: MarC family protein [Pseudorhodoplanes sp.]|jgi:multiple antibiotic resistance protein|nr:MarC family protein [Pseudorhodoplanes sp.]